MSLRTSALVLCAVLATAIFPLAVGAQEPKPGSPAGGAVAEGEKNVDVEFATVLLKLAKVDLQQALDFNARVAGSYSGAEVDRLRRVVTFAEEQLDFAKNAAGKPGVFNLFNADSDLRNAQDNLEKAVATNARAAGTISDIALEKLRLTVELARLNVAKGRAAAESNSPAAMMQWQLDQLRLELLQLRNRVEAISARR